MTRSDSLKTSFKWFSGPVGGILVCMSSISVGMKVEMAKTLGLCVFMIIWWLNAPVRMGITGLLPIVFLPLLGVCSGVSISKEYFSDSVVICWATLLIATAVEKYELHNRFAKRLLNMTEKFGINGILCGFVFITGFLSMWLSNTATAALMTPMSNAVFIKLKEDVKTNCNFELHDDMEHPTIGIVQRSAVSHRISTGRPNTRCYSEEEIRRAATAVDLSIAYAASLGGMATLTGTGSNIVLQGTLLTLFGTDGAVSFLGWMVLFAPLALLNLIELWLVLMCCFTTNSPWNNTSVDRLRSSSSEALTPSSLHLPSDIPRHRSSQAGHTNTLTRHVKERDEEAPLSYPQKVVLLTFCVMIALWVTRDPPGGWGWSRLLLSSPRDVTDGTVAMMCCLFLLVVPVTPPNCYFRPTTHSIRSPVPSRHSRYSRAAINEDANEPHLDEGGEGEEVIVEMTTSHIETTRRHCVDADDRIITDNERQTSSLSSEVTGLSQHEPHNPLADRRGGAVLSWSAVQDLNWDVVFLLGGGFALSKGFQESGLSEWMSEAITSRGGMSLSVVIVTATLAACGVTNVMSNVATANILLPALACVGPRHHVAPLVILAPVVLGTSLAFLFPVGTPPNAIVLANGNVQLGQMARVGAICTLLHITTILLYCLFLMPLMFDISVVPQSVLDACGATN